MTQRDLVSQKIFNIVVDTVVRAVLLEVCGIQEAHHGFVWASGEHNIVFYADNDCIAWRNTIWVQMALIEMLSMFKRVGLLKNIDNTKAMVCTPGLIWVQQGTVAYKRRATGEGDMFREQKKTKVRCEECGREMV